jgi:hypothetical protein
VAVSTTATTAAAVFSGYRLGERLLVERPEQRRADERGEHRPPRAGGSETGEIVNEALAVQDSSS